MRDTYTHGTGRVEKLVCTDIDMNWVMGEVAEYALNHALDGEWDDDTAGQRAALIIFAKRINKKLDAGRSPRVV